MKKRMNIKGQEEMVGFGLIIVIVAVVILVFLSLSIKPSAKNIESYEVESFLQTTLYYTSECETYIGFLSVQDLIKECEDSGLCLNDKKACEILNNTLKEISSEAWSLKQDSFVKGYELKVVSGQKELIIITKGNKTQESKGSLQNLPENLKVTMDIYY